jgi:hypothetical protein
MEVLGDVGHVGSCFGPFGESVSARAILVQDRCTVCSKRTIGSEVVLDTPNDTPR